jgi:hypothetical protein
MKPGFSRRRFLQTATAGVILSPAVIGRAQAAIIKLKMSSSGTNDPKFANGRPYYDFLLKHLRDNKLDEQVEVAFFPDNQLGQEIDVINSVKLGVIDMMVSGTSISANLVPLVGTFDLGYLFDSFPQQTKAFPHPAEPGYHRMSAPDGGICDTAGVRRSLHCPAGRRYRRPRARSANNGCHEVLRDREVLFAHRA